MSEWLSDWLVLLPGQDSGRGIGTVSPYFQSINYARTLTTTRSLTLS
jgi:hypothetical protein